MEDLQLLISEFNHEWSQTFWMMIKPPRASKPFGTLFHGLYAFRKTYASETRKAKRIYVIIYIYLHTCICTLYLFIYTHQTPLLAKNNLLRLRIFRCRLAANASPQVFHLVGRDYKPQLAKLNGLDGFYWAAPISVPWVFEGRFRTNEGGVGEGLGAIEKTAARWDFFLKEIDGPCFFQGGLVKHHHFCWSLNPPRRQTISWGMGGHLGGVGPLNSND